MLSKKGNSTERGNRVERVIRAPAGEEEVGWTRELEFETYSMKGGLLSHRTRLCCCRNPTSRFLLPLL